MRLNCQNVINKYYCGKHLKYHTFWDTYIWDGVSAKMDNRLIFFTCLILHCMINGQTLTTAGQEHGRELNPIHSLQNEINNLKTEHASTMN